MADHQLNENEVEAVPAEGVEELPEAIIIPVLGNSTESDSTESETSSQPRARTPAVFWAGAVCGVGDGRSSFCCGDIMLQVWRCKCERWSGECVRVQIYIVFSGPTTPKKSRGAKKNYVVKMERLVRAK